MTTEAPKKPEAKSDRYRDTVFLPKTGFPMKAGLPQKEPELLKRWADMDLFGKLRQQSKGREKFILHDGPPYANGNIHIGHALNKILKDLVTRSRQMAGFDSHYVPGWDCHGLPIEWKIEEQYRAKGKNKDAIPVKEFRKECRDFAAHWIDVQREEFKRLGVEGDWDNPYTTMKFESEAVIARELMKFADTGQLYRGSKPVMWSVVEKTALAEAEVEYQDIEVDTIFVKFPIKEKAAEQTLAYGDNPTVMLGGLQVRDQDAEDENREQQRLRNAAWEMLDQAAILIWTTTPWTIPGNRAIAYSRKVRYGLYKVSASENEDLVRVGDLIVFAENLLTDISNKGKIECKYVGPVLTEDLQKISCIHPLSDKGYLYTVPLLDGEYVTDDTGTGFVHTAPSHGADDYNVWIANQKYLQARKIDITVPTPVDENGFYTKDAPGFDGGRVIDQYGKWGNANKLVMEALKSVSMLVAANRKTISYPHSWRSKKPIIFRNTPQWFISMGDGQTDSLRDKALAAIEATEFFPPAGKNRLRGMIEQRPDWVISRQRAWGVPITVFVEKATGKILNDPKVNQRIYDSFCQEGADAWFAEGAATRFLAPDYNSQDFEQVRDILDVWFDSGCTHAFTLEDRPDLKWPADMYLEGSDQHRGWFHSSLLESCGTRGRAPYNQVLTHGFTMAEDGRKMSKSLGNIVAPQDVIKNSGADILRLWVSTSDYSDDQRIGPEILKSNVEAYRKLRNTFRYMLGALEGLHDWEELRNIKVKEQPELESYILHKLWELDQVVQAAYKVYDYKRITAALMQFMNTDLSAFYFDIRKDSLYCDPWSSAKRRACRAVIDQLFHCLTTWWAPILVFTMEEVWLSRFGGEGSSVHLMPFARASGDWRNDALAAKWDRIREIRSAITGALEIERANKTIGSSLEASPQVYIVGITDSELLKSVDFAEVCITSGIDVISAAPPPGAFTQDGIGVVFKKAEGAKCARSWKISKDIGSDKEFPDITPRDADAVREWQKRNGKSV